MVTEAHSRPSAHPGGRDFVGVVYGDVGSTALKFSVIRPVERNEFVQVPHETCGLVLGRVEEVERHTDLSLEKAQLLGTGEAVEIEEKMSASVAVVGYRDDRDLLQVPRTPFRAGAEVQHADEALIKQVLGLRDDRHHGAYVGLLAGHGIKVYLDINAMVQKHVSVLAKTGGGKAYITGVMIEELMKHHVTCVILDPHGEYASLAEKGKVAHGSERFDVDPRGYREVIQVFSPDVKVSPHARPLKFTLSNLDARDILSLTGGGGKLRQHLTALRKALDLLKQTSRDYSMMDIIRLLEKDEDPQNAALVDDLERGPEVRPRDPHRHAAGGKGGQERAEPVQHADHPEGHEPERPEGDFLERRRADPRDGGRDPAAPDRRCDRDRRGPPDADDGRGPATGDPPWRGERPGGPRLARPLVTWSDRPAQTFK